MIGQTARMSIPDPALVVLVGASGSGKSTWAAGRYRAEEVVSSDALRGLVGSGAHDLDASTDAFAVLERHTVDVLVSDIGMPGGDGVDLLHEIRQRHPDHNGFVPAIALTGFSDGTTLERMKAAGFRRHLVKPIDVDMVVRAVAESAAEA